MWHPSDCMKRCYPSVFRGRSARKIKGFPRMEKDIGKIKKNDTSEIILRIDDFGGRKGLTIREFVTSEKYTGFTKAGVRILSPDFLKFREMINSISLSDLQDESSEEKKDAPKKQKTLSKPKVQEELPDY